MKKTILLTALGICCMVAATSRTKAAEKVSGKYHYEIINSTQKTAALTKVEQPGTQVILPSSIDGYTIVQLGTMKENNYHFASASTLRLEGKAELFSAADAEKVTELTIPSKVEKIGVMSFQGCKKIKKVTLPKALTHIGSNAFNGCEPTGALDSNTSDDIMDVFEELNKNGHTVIIVTHDNGVAARCQRVIEIKDGEVLSE